jgi:hypothetical protein
MYARGLGAVSVLVVCSACVGLLIAGESSAQQRTGLSWSTDGPVPDSLPDLRNPNYLMRLGQVQALLVELRRRPRDESYIRDMLSGTGVMLEDLLALPLIRRDGELYAPSFPLLTSEDLRYVREVSERYAGDLAEEYLQHRTEFEELMSRYPVEHVPLDRVAFVLLGCFSLDWDGLDITEESGYRTPFLSEGVGKVHWATEQEPRGAAKAAYRGSHNQTFGDGITLTSFGDHYAPFRFAFPDLVWNLGRAFPDVLWQAARSYGVEVPEELRPALAAIGRRTLAELAEDVGSVMMALRAGEMSAEDIAEITGGGERETEALLSLLEALEYVRLDAGRYATVIPVFSQGDGTMVQEVLSLGHDLLTGWLEENYGALEADLTRGTPLGDPLPFEDSFYYVWHYVFGITNRILVEERMFEDPYSDDRKYPGFVPVVWHRSVKASG